MRKFLANESVTEYFDLMIFSEEIGIRKPDRRIFHLAARRLGVQPSEIVHVGDNLKTDVWGAKTAGLKAIYFSSQEGRDRIAESDPNSLVSLAKTRQSRKLQDSSRQGNIFSRHAHKGNRTTGNTELTAVKCAL